MKQMKQMYQTVEQYLLAHPGIYAPMPVLGPPPIGVHPVTRDELLAKLSPIAKALYVHPVKLKEGDSVYMAPPGPFVVLFQWMPA